MEKRIYFKNLNALRFLAATLVIFHHIEQYKLWANLPNIFGDTTIDALGHKAVSFFFVLSGFLITYLLLTEHKQTGDIHIRNFYVRRILRIWPLYYFIVILCLFVLPNIFDLGILRSDIYSKNFGLVTLLLFLVLPNLVRLFQPTIVGGNQLWSIGVEEQFYLVWPLLVRWFMNSILLFLFVFIGLKLVVMIGLDALAISHNTLFIHKLVRFWELLQIEQMAIGALGAWALFNQREKILNLIYHPLTHYGSLVLLCAIFIVPVHHWWINYAEAFIFVVVIMNLSTNPAIKLNLENKTFSVLGNISYGIYMYHTVCITVCLLTLKEFGIDRMNMTFFNILLYTLSTCMTIAVAYFSYELFEKRFLELKERFMIVKSGKKSSPEDEQIRQPLATSKIPTPPSGT